MQLNQLFADDEAVSPVIGVILMVAITVILAAVIASFVIGVGEQNQEVQPQASFGFDYDGSSSAIAGFDGNVTVTFDSGDAIPSQEVFLRGQNFQDSQSATNNSWFDYNNTQGSNDYSASVSGEVGSQEAVVGGDFVELGANSTYDIRVVWESAEGDNSATLTADEGPDA